MVQITADPRDPSKLVLSVTATIFLDRILIETLNEEVEKAIRTQAAKDLRGNKEVQKSIADAATKKLLQLLGAETPAGTP